MTPEEIHTEILKALNAKGMTQKGLAFKVGVSPTYINSCINGGTDMRISVLCDIVNVLEIKL